MCGLVGFLRESKDLAEARSELTQMLSTLVHRGPDGWGIYVSRNASLGHTRLAIIDPKHGKQPFITNRYVLCYNGEVYNHLELRKELESLGVRFKTRCDTEVVLKAYATWKTDAFPKFNGQFALILWDRQKKHLLLARDRYGIRPLYVLHHNNAFYFSSELKAFDTLPGYSRRFNPQHLYTHGLLWNTLADATVYENIRSVEAGTVEQYSLGRRPSTKKYYEVGETEPSRPKNFDEAREQFQILLDDAVRLRLRSDVPVGTYLSGGIDSSVISDRVNHLNNNRLKTFSVAFRDQEFDESTYQVEMIRYLRCEHTSLNISYHDIESKFLESIYHCERPIFRSAPVPLYHLSEKVRASGIKVILTGEGADEILYGYDSFKELKLLQFWNIYPSSRCRPQLIKRLYPHLHHYQDPKQFGLMKMYYEGFLSMIGNNLAGLNVRVHNNKILYRFFSKDFQRSIDSEEIIDSIKTILPASFKHWTLLQRNSFLEIKSLLSGYLLSSQGDRMSMAHSVEGRYPFLDHRLVEFAFHLPDRYKLRVFSQKHILTESFKNTIPSAIVQRPKRPYMAPDIKTFFKKGLPTDQVSHFLSEKMIKEYGIFDSKHVIRFLRKLEKQPQDRTGYRDNMIIVFLLSAQMACYWADHPRPQKLALEKKEVDFTETTNS